MLNNQLLFIKLLKYFVVILLSFFNILIYAKDNEKTILDLAERIKENQLELEHVNKNYEQVSLRKKRLINKNAIQQQQLANNIIAIYKLKKVPAKIILQNNNNFIAYLMFNYYTNYLNEKLKNNAEYLTLMKKEEQDLVFIKNKIQTINKKLEENNNLLKQNIAVWQKNNIFENSKELLSQSQNLINSIPNITNQYILKQDLIDDVKVKQNTKNFAPPTSGFLQQSYNYGSKQNLFYNGLLFIALPNSSIVAPFDGEIIYIDNQQVGNLENLIIIKHSASYISLIIGNFEVIAKPTQLVKKSEIIGYVKKQITPIYYEINYKNKPQNPNIWLSN